LLFIKNTLLIFIVVNNMKNKTTNLGIPITNIIFLTYGFIVLLKIFNKLYVISKMYLQCICIKIKLTKLILFDSEHNKLITVNLFM